jgi:hypothetical protein
LGFIGQGSGSEELFYLFGLVLFPSLLFLGLATFARVLQSSIEDFLYARGINRIRHFYIELVPQMQDYFILSSNDDARGVLHNMALTPSKWQLLFTGAGMVAVINSVIAAVLAGLLVHQFIGPSFLWGVGVGLGVFLVSVLAHERYQEVARQRATPDVKVLFPSEPE